MSKRIRNKANKANNTGSNNVPYKRGSSKSNDFFETPLDELISCMDRMEMLVDKTRNEYWPSKPPSKQLQQEPTMKKSKSWNEFFPNEESEHGDEIENNKNNKDNNSLNKDDSSSSSRGGDKQLSRGWRRAASDSTGSDENMKTTTPSKPPITPSSSKNNNNRSQQQQKQIDAEFLPINSIDQDELIEVIRRTAELVVHGERGAAREKKKRDELYNNRGLLTEDEDEHKRLQQEADATVDSHIAIFEHFFERNILALIVNIATGVAFLPDNNNNNSYSELQQTDDDEGTNGYNNNNNNANSNTTMLPPLPVATQAVQSVSILIQNVSRATSLYFLLSNNFINELINLPLELYGIAELSKRGDYSTTNMLQGFSPRKYTSPEIAELSTHFVSFLKSLALRMNKETLQFYLTYPNEGEGGSASSAYFSNEKKDDNDGIKIITEQEPSSPIKKFVNDDDDDERPLDEISSNNTVEKPQQKQQQKQQQTPQQSRTRTTIGSKPSKQPVSVDKIEVEFPLYARALEFCAPHHDSFVRVTAMNVCLNTLRLCVLGESTTNSDDTTDNNDEFNNSNSNNMSSPGGIKSPSADLQHADPLPLRERLAIAQHVCAPSRVEGLVSPIFTKLAQLWSVLEESIREIDTISHNRLTNSGGPPSSDNVDPPAASSSRRFGGSSSNRGGINKSNLKWKAERAKDEVKIKKLSDSFKDSAADLQDELELLEDVFKVGLTSLNEQIIEMMLATFVYPLLLQPLLLYAQRFPSSPRQQQKNGGGDNIDSLNNSFSNLGGGGREDEKGGRGGGGGEHLDTAPAKTACFSLGAVFHLITNRPLLRLLLTALLHPLAPEASGQSMIRAKPDIACATIQGKVCVRVDQLAEPDSVCIPNERTSYLFGKLTGRRGSSQHHQQLQQKEESCVFVLSPALADVLESHSNDGATSLLSRTRPNPYRRAILSCLADTFGMSELRSLAVYTVDAAVSKFDGKFVSDILFGIGLKTFGDDIPVDERKSDTRRVRAAHDRGMGGPAQSDTYSRHTLSTKSRFQTGGDSDYMVEVIASLCVSVMNAYNSSIQRSQSSGLRALKFDKTAAHALLCITRQNPKSIQTAAKLIERRRSQTASYVAQLPSRIYPQQEGIPEEEDEQRLGILMDRIFYESFGGGTKKAVVEHLFRFADPPPQGVLLNQPDNDFLIPITMESSYDDLSNGICLNDDAFNDINNDSSLPIAAECANAHIQLDVFANLMHELAATNANAIKQSENKKLAGFAISQSGMIVDTTVHWEKICQKSIFSPLSRDLTSVLFEEQNEDDTASTRSHRHHHRSSSDHSRGLPKAGSVVGLVGRTAFPCVCEVPTDNSSLFTDDGACVVAEGVKWQSLYLVFLGRYMILAEPERGGSGGNGRIVTSCNLAKLKVEKDEVPPEGQGGSPARRLLLTHDSFIERTPPSLFVLEEKPTYKEYSNLFRSVTNTTTCLDLWFEDENAADRAFKVIDVKIAKSKSKHGNKIREKLSPTG